MRLSGYSVEQTGGRCRRAPCDSLQHGAYGTSHDCPAVPIRSFQRPPIPRRAPAPRKPPLLAYEVNKKREDLVRHSQSTPKYVMAGISNLVCKKRSPASWNRGVEAIARIEAHNAKLNRSGPPISANGRAVLKANCRRVLKGVPFFDEGF